MKVYFCLAQRCCIGLILLSLLAACSGPGRPTPTASDRPSVEQFHRQGIAQLAAKNLTAAAGTLDVMETTYPLHAETGAMYIALLEGYKAGDEPDKAIALADDFVRMFPSHKDVVYAHYLAAMADYERGRYAMSMDVAKTDPRYAKAALARFKTLLACCDNNEYAFNARQYIYHLESMISLYELRYMEWDYDAGRIETAAQRGLSIVASYPGSVAAERAGALLSAAAFAAYRPAESVAQPSVEETVVVEVNTPPPVAVQSETVAEAKVTELPAETFYTVQLMSYSQLEQLQKALAAQGLADAVSLYSHVVNGKTYFIATYGHYADRTMAKAGLAELQQRTGRSDYWLRKVESDKLSRVN